MRKGEQWERILDSYHHVYMKTGLARIFQCHPGVRMVERGRIVYETEGPPDFMGFLRGGHGVIFDAKEIKASRLPFAKIRPHQARAFAEAAKAGAHPFLAVRCADGDFVVSWQTIYPVYQKWAGYEADATASIVVAEVGLPIPGGWLEVVNEEILRGRM